MDVLTYNGVPYTEEHITGSDATLARIFQELNSEQLAALDREAAAGGGAPSSAAPTTAGGESEF